MQATQGDWNMDLEALDYLRRATEALEVIAKHLEPEWKAYHPAEEPSVAYGVGVTEFNPITRVWR
jgi:hypothetical protein